MTAEISALDWRGIAVGAGIAAGVSVPLLMAWGGWLLRRNRNRKGGQAVNKSLHDKIREAMEAGAGRTYTNAQLRELFCAYWGDDGRTKETLTKAVTRAWTGDLAKSQRVLGHYAEGDKPLIQMFGVVRLEQGDRYVWREWPDRMNDLLPSERADWLAADADTRRRRNGVGANSKQTADGQRVEEEMWRAVVVEQRRVCGGCGETMDRNGQIQIDHITPRAKEGETKLGNLLALCWECNNTKGKRTMEELWAKNEETGFMLNKTEAVRAWKAAVALGDGRW